MSHCVLVLLALSSVRAPNLPESGFGYIGDQSPGGTPFRSSGTPVLAAHSAVVPNGKLLSYGTKEGLTDIQDGRTLVFRDTDRGYGDDSMIITSNWLSDGTYIASAGSVPEGSSHETLLLDYATEHRNEETTPFFLDGTLP